MANGDAKYMSNYWSVNITVRTQVSAFLGGIFFGVLWFMAMRQETRSLVETGDSLSILTIFFLTMTFVCFAFSTFAFALSADMFRKSAVTGADAQYWEKRARNALYAGASFFKSAYVSMMLSLGLVLAHAHIVFGIIGLVAFGLAWALLYMKTGPYKERNVDGNNNRKSD